jgi:hypothetical protein
MQKVRLIVVGAGFGELSFLEILAMLWFFSPGF